MFPVLRKTASVCSLITLIALLTAVAASADTQTYRLNNGMQVILKENHASPMVASVIFVKSGSKYESTYENGITHFLEHLLFDGTTNMSREKLDRSITDLGGYINAFTRKDETAYLVLLPKQYIQFGMAVQADMLFNSIFPDSEMTKERKVVIEEINRDADAPNAPADAYFTDQAYAGTDYARPVLGYKAFIENIPRAAVVEYWKKFYRPSRMTMLVIGDFNADTMKAAVESVFGAISDTPDNSPASVPGKETITGGTRFDTTAAVASTFINFSFAAPAFGDSSFLAIDMLARYLDLGDISPLKRDLMGADPLATDVTVSFVPYDGFSRLEVSIVTDKPAMRDSIVGSVIRDVAEISKASIDTTVLAGIKTSLKCEYVLTSEKLHYYGFMIAPQLPITGWDFVENYPTLLSKIDWPACQKAAATWFTDPLYVVTTVRPLVDSTAPHYVPSGLTADQVIKHFDSVKFVDRDLSAGYPIKFPNTEEVSLKFDDHAKYVRKVLPNGLVVLIKSSLDSRVFALDVLGRDRAANEPAGKAGITDFVNRCMEKGTTKRSAEQLTRDLAAIGANVTLYDNPWIPYDDRYTTPQFSFFKFETIDEYARSGFKLFAEMLAQPAFDSTEVAKIRQGMLGTLKRDAASPGTVAKGLFYRTLFAGKPYANPVMGTPETIAAITIDDLRAYHKMYYAPDNIVLAIATNQDPSTIMQWIEETIGTSPKGGAAAVTDRTPIAVSSHVTDHVELAKEQMSIIQGGPLPSISSPEAASLEIGISILSDHLYSNLREKQGLAYSVGAGSFFDRDFGWYYCSMGTSAQKYKEAVDGINLQIDKLRLDGVTPEEIRRSRNQIWGRLLSAKLSRINQAYYMAANEFFGLPPNYDAQYIASLSGVTPQSISSAFGKYVRTDACVTVTAGKKQQ